MHYKKEFIRGFCISIVIWSVGLSGGLLITSDGDWGNHNDPDYLQFRLEQLGTTDIFVNNSKVVVAALSGILTVSLSSIFVLLGNGFHAGVMWNALSYSDSAGQQLIEITLSHGILELLALFTASAVGLLGFRLFGLIINGNSSFAGLRHAAPLFLTATLIALLLTGIAAVVEAHSISNLHGLMNRPHEP